MDTLCELKLAPTCPSLPLLAHCLLFLSKFSKIYKLKEAGTSTQIAPGWINSDQLGSTWINLDQLKFQQNKRKRILLPIYGFKFTKLKLSLLFFELLSRSHFVLLVAGPRGSSYELVSCLKLRSRAQ